MGVGKATVALRLAMAANCEQREGPLPCTVCRTCRLIAARRHPDIIWVEPDPSRASRKISVEQARNVVHKLVLHRHSAKQRFVIIDPVDSMGIEATNALLKTLEEPPHHSGFILISSRPASLLPTVLSRSLRMRFHSVATADLQRWLENRGVERAGLVARLSFGSPGQALVLAEGRLEAMTQARTDLLAGISSGPRELFAYTEKLTSSSRNVWMERVELTLEVLSLLLRDTVTLGAGSEADLLQPDLAHVSRRWADALWPRGLIRVDEAISQAWRQLELNVSGRVVMDALLSCLATELGSRGRRVDPHPQEDPHGP